MQQMRLESCIRTRKAGNSGKERNTFQRTPVLQEKQISFSKVRIRRWSGAFFGVTRLTTARPSSRSILNGQVSKRPTKHEPWPCPHNLASAFVVTA